MDTIDFDSKYRDFLKAAEDVWNNPEQEPEEEACCNKDISSVIAKSKEYVREYKEANKLEAVDVRDRIPTIKQPVFRDSTLVGWQKTVDRRTALERETDTLSNLLFGGKRY